jgi:hypothetical protein
MVLNRRLLRSAAMTLGLAGLWLAPQALAAQHWAYVWGNQPNASACYDATGAFTGNSAGQANEVCHLGTGWYGVYMPGVATGLPLGGGTVQVTAYGADSSYCNIQSWGVDTSSTPSRIFLYLQCYTAAGAPVDTSFVAQYSGLQSHMPHFGFVDAEHEDAPFGVPYSPPATLQWSSTDPSGSSQVTHTATGSYQVRLHALARRGGTVVVTGGQPGSSDVCAVSEWIPSGPDELVDVSCTTSAGVPADTDFDVTFSDAGSMLGDGSRPVAYVWANEPTTAHYTPALRWNFNSAGGHNRVLRSGVGSYLVKMPGLDLGLGHVEVSAYGTGGARCKVVGWNAHGVAVRCYSAAGAPADSRFVAQFTS